MATITGGKLRTPRGVLSWRPVVPVVKAYQFLTKSGTDGYQCLGVPGNQAHLTAAHPGDHTPYSTHDITIGGVHYVPKKGWVYAFDAHVPDMAGFERWFLARLRAGYYPAVKYWNINNRHWNRRVVVGGKPFGKSSYSADGHLHVSIMPDSEYVVVDFLADYEAYRKTGKNRPGAPAPRSAPSTPAKAPSKPMDAAAGKLPTVRKGATGTPVKLAQALLVHRGLWPRTDGSARAQIDGQFGDGTAGKVSAFQAGVGLPASSVVDARTWMVLAPDVLGTVIRGTDGPSAWLMQLLLYARGFDPGVLDGHAGDDTIAALKRFQAARRVANSVVAGRGDGIGGPASWVALVTL